ncbi:MAG: uncharacterized protein JWN21_1056 [Sphingomonas bacterium]|uniref:DUF2891 family protein n=1 Tax=Sphingomonas bacterium TaxID=1895847 RepID=UPI0026042DE3|nr:DUF2891 family protein [Sphingomonas bacterium]MDB5695513.1 uncharacterized protein [Sphingomonas bacterium]
MFGGLRSSEPCARRWWRARDACPPIAAGFARLTLEHVGREYPYKRDQVLTGPEDVTLPSTLHPIFHGSFDWQSCVHGWWQLLTIARLFPDLPEAAEIRARADEMLRVEKVAGEVAYLDRPGTAGFERPYGWAWALALHSEAARHEAGWGAALEPLARAFALRFRLFLPKLSYPVRTGAHGNIAFALVLAGGNSGRGHAACARMNEATDRHLRAALPHLDDDYMGGHWLATFALLALVRPI